MGTSVRLLLFASILLSSISSFAQHSGLFAPFDCRKHGDLFEEVIIEDPVLTIVESSMIMDVEPIPFVEIDTVNAWQEWRIVQNYSFGKDRGSMPMITDLNALHPYFRDKIVELIAKCKSQGIELSIVESYRTHAKQSEYKGMGRKYTSSKAGRSKHQYGLAVDLVPIVDSVAVWDNSALWRKIGITGEKLGLRWGGRWRKPYDPGHFEWTSGLTSSQLTAGYFPPVPKQKDAYPCLEEDISLLKRYWKEWETAQSALTRK
jgi:hypothetical protein